MTRINLIQPEELHYKHLVAEYREITRVPTLARKAQRSLHKLKIPNQHVLGTGHVLFFYQRLGFIADRYEQLLQRDAPPWLRLQPNPTIRIAERY